jgi:hypothetical protein
MATFAEEIERLERGTPADRQKAADMSAERGRVQRAVRGYTPTDTASYIDPEQGVMRPGTIQERETRFQDEATDRARRAEYQRIYDQEQAEQAQNQKIQVSEAEVERAWNTFSGGRYPDDDARDRAFQPVIRAEYAASQLRGGRETLLQVEERIKRSPQFTEELERGFRGPGPGGDPQGTPDEEAVTEIIIAVQAGDMNEDDARRELTALGVSLANQNRLITHALGDQGGNWLTDAAGNIANWVTGLFDKDDSDRDVAQGLGGDMGNMPPGFSELDAEEALARQQQGERAIYTDYLNRAIPEGASNIYRQYVEGRGQPLRDLFNQRRDLGLGGIVPEEGQPGGETFAGYLSGLEPHRSTYAQRADLMSQTAGLWNRDEPFDLTTQLGLQQQRYKRELEQNPFQQYTLVKDLARIGVPQAMKAASDKQVWEDYSKWFTATGGTGSAGNVPQYLPQYWNQRNP